MCGHVLLHGCHDRRVLLGRPGLPYGVAWRYDVAAILVLFNGIAHDVTAPIATCAGWSIRLRASGTAGRLAIEAKACVDLTIKVQAWTLLDARRPAIALAGPAQRCRTPCRPSDWIARARRSRRVVLSMGFQHGRTAPDPKQIADLRLLASPSAERAAKSILFCATAGRDSSSSTDRAADAEVAAPVRKPRRLAPYPSRS